MRERARLIEVLRTVNVAVVQWAPLLHRAADHLQAGKTACGRVAGGPLACEVDYRRLVYVANDPRESPHIRELAIEAAQYLWRGP